MKHRHKLRTTFCTIISLETARYLCYNLTFLKLYNAVIVEYTKAICLNPNNDSTDLGEFKVQARSHSGGKTGFSNCIETR